MGSVWGCPDLTDSGLGTKPKENPHEDTVIEACSRQGELPDEYKQQALELWRASGRSAAKVAAHSGFYWIFCVARATNSSNLESKSFRMGDLFDFL